MVTLSISQIIRATLTSFLVCPYEFIGNVEVGIYKRKQEREKEGKHAFDQESDQDKKKKRYRSRKKNESQGQESKI